MKIFLKRAHVCDAEEEEEEEEEEFCLFWSSFWWSPSFLLRACFFEFCVLLLRRSVVGVCGSSSFSVFFARPLLPPSRVESFTPECDFHEERGGVLVNEREKRERERERERKHAEEQKPGARD